MTNPALEQLKDIHLPQPVHWWPPAPGWWIVAILLFALVFYSSRYLLNRYRRQYFYAETQDLLQQHWARYQQALSDTQCKHSPDREFIENTLALVRRAGKTSQIALDDKTRKHLESTPTPALLEALNQNSDDRLSTVIPLEDISQRLYREDGKMLTNEQVQCFYEVARKWLKSADFKHTDRNRGAKC